MLDPDLVESDDDGDYLDKDDCFLEDRNMGFAEWSAEINGEADPQRKEILELLREISRGEGQIVPIAVTRGKRIGAGLRIIGITDEERATCNNYLRSFKTRGLHEDYLKEPCEKRWQCDVNGCISYRRKKDNKQGFSTKYPLREHIRREHEGPTDPVGCDVDECRKQGSVLLPSLLAALYRP